VADGDEPADRPALEQVVEAGCGPPAEGVDVQVRDEVLVAALGDGDGAGIGRPHLLDRGVRTRR
jgi:hypothetical protein